MTTALLSLGSNLGDRAANLRQAVERLKAVEALKPVKISPVYRTPPWGDADQPDYLNAVVLVEGPRTPHGWLETAQDLERAGGRVRDPARRFGPRTLDVDIIAVWDDDGSPVTVDDPDLTVPHPRAHLRAFVLRPWLDLQPEADLPGLGRVDDLIRTAPVAADLPDVVRAADVSLTKTA